MRPLHWWLNCHVLMSSNKAISSTLFICAKPLLNQSPVAVIITRSDHSPWLAHWTVHRSLKEILYKTQGFPSSYVTLMPPPVDSETGRRAHLAKLREGHFFFLFFQKLSDFFKVIFFLRFLDIFWHFIISWVFFWTFGGFFLLFFLIFLLDFLLCFGFLRFLIFGFFYFFDFFLDCFDFFQSLYGYKGMTVSTMTFPIWLWADFPDRVNFVRAGTGVSGQCWTNIWIFKYIWIYLGEYIHSFKYSLIFPRTNIFGYSFVIYLYWQIYSDIHLSNSYDKEYIWIFSVSNKW